MPLPIPEDIGSLTVPMVLGHCFNWCLFGMLFVQTYVYYLAFPRDRTRTKAVVAFIFFCEVIQTLCATRDAFRNFGSHWGDVEDLDEIGWLWFSVPVMSAIISTTTHLFFAWRIWVLSNSRSLPGAISLVSIISGCAAATAGVWTHFLGQFSKIADTAYPASITWLVSAAVSDVAIALSMIYYLLGSQTGIKSTGLLITKIIRVSVETGLVCAGLSCLDLILFLVFPNTNFHLTPSISLCKLYSNSLLVVLNSRVRIVGGRVLSTTVTHSIMSDESSPSVPFDETNRNARTSAISLPAPKYSIALSRMSSTIPIDEHSLEDTAYAETNITSDTSIRTSSA